MPSPFVGGCRYEVVPARPADLPACGALLPAARRDAEPCHWAVARDVLSRQIVGAVAVSREILGTPVAGPRVAVRVAERVRRRGIGRQLIEYAAALPHRPEVNALHAWDLVNAANARAIAWGWLGFVVGEVMVRHELDLPAYMLELEPLYAQLVARGGIPPDAKVEPMGPQHVAAVAEMNAEYLGSSRERVLANLSDPDRRGYDPACSAVLTLNGEVVGFSMARMAGDGVCEWDAIVLRPSVRRGWANLMLKTENARLALAAGTRALRYCTLPRHGDSRHHSRRAGGREIEQLLRMYRPLAVAKGRGSASATGARVPQPQG